MAVAILLLLSTAAMTLLTGFGAQRFGLALAGAALGEALLLAVIHLLRGQRSSSMEFTIGSFGVAAGVLSVEWLTGHQCSMRAAFSQAAWAEVLSVGSVYAWAIGGYLRRPGLNPGATPSAVELIVLVLAVASSGVLGYRIAA